MSYPLDDPTPLPAAYAEDALDRPAGVRLEGSIQAEIAIIGAGFTGVSAALHLAKAGRHPVVIDAREVGWGASGRNFGQVVPYTKHSEAHALKALGPLYGERLVGAAGAGPDFVFGLIAEHAIPCWATRNGLLFAAHAPADRAALERRTAYWQGRGVAVEMLDRTRTQALIGSELYSSALLDPRGGTINPLAYVRGLARAAEALGARFYTNSRVKSLRPRADGWDVGTVEGGVQAETVLIATDAYTDGFAPDLERMQIPLRAYQLVSKPLDANVRATILPGGQALTDTRRLYSGVRVHPTGRLHVSLDGPPFGAGTGPFVAKLKRRVAKAFPRLGDVEWEESWSGWVGMTADQYPRLVKMAPGLLAALGYSGRGIALATLFGRELAQHVTGTPERDLLLPITAPEPIRVKPFARPLVGGLINLYRILDGVDDARLRSH